MRLLMRAESWKFGGGALLLLGSCTAMLLRGGSTHSKGPPPNTAATFIAPNCSAVPAGTPVPGVAERFYLARSATGKLDLFELDARGKGKRLENYWQDEQGHHWNYFIRGKDAYAFLIPDDQKAVGWRYVYPKGTYRVQGPESGAFRIVGQHSAECPMIPIDQNGQPLVAPPAGPPVADAGAEAAVEEPEEDEQICVPGTTQECYGPGACKGGQSCLDDGSGFSDCDCGPSDEDAGADAASDADVDAAENE